VVVVKYGTYLVGVVDEDFVDKDLYFNFDK
jgi:hypothetical protein